MDEIDDQGKQKKNLKNKAPVGGKDFGNMGSTPVERRKEEEKVTEFKMTGVRPRFTGKAKIGGG